MKVLARFARCTMSVTAEHYVSDTHEGMRYALRVVGGKHNGVEIHCKTEASVIALFNEVVSHYKSGTTHPYLAPVN